MVKCKISILIFDILNYIDNVYKRIFNIFFPVLKAKVFILSREQSSKVFK